MAKRRTRAEKSATQSPATTPGDLPEGWAVAPLRDVIQPSKEKIDPRRVPDSPYLGLEHIESNSRRIIRQAKASEAASTKAVFQAGDVLYGKLRPYLNKVCRPTFDGVCSTDIIVFPQKPELDSRFLMYFLNRPEVVEATTHAMAGVNLPRIGFDTLGDLEFPLPPLAEQKRIADRIETLLKEVDAARERLAKVPDILQRFRQSILVAACSGSLTEEWRESNPNVETGEQLLRRITAERQSAIAKGKSRKTADADEEKKEVDLQAATWDIPDTWTWCRIAEVLHYQRSAAYGVLQPGSDLLDGVPFVRVCDLGNGTVETREIKRIAKMIDAQYPRTRLHGGEVLVTLVGTIGRIAVVPQHLAGANVARAVGMLPLCPHVLPEYLRITLDQPAKNTELVDLAREVARKTLNLGLLKAVSVPLPPLAEQVEIFRRVGEFQKVIADIDNRVSLAMSRTERLAQASLGKAFSGELVLTEAELASRESRSFETGEELLRRVRETPMPPKARVNNFRGDNRRKTSDEVQMQKLSPESVSSAIRTMKKPSFTFSELRDTLAADYEPLKEIVFRMLDDAESGLTQVFDKKSKSMHLLWRNT